MIVGNEDVVEVHVGVPEGHRHLRTRIVLRDGSEFVFQEATIANIMRAFVTVKTDPVKKSVMLKGRRLQERKEGFAEWQLLEE
ncbi:MAG: hypothetical protein P8Z71_09165 [Candidatus Sulfobium sp.]|jgi:hypothetical protein